MTAGPVGPSVQVTDVVTALWERRGPLTLVIGSITAIAIAITFLLPTWYRAGAEFTIEAGTPATPSSGVLGLASQLGISALAGGAPTVNYYEEVLGSDVVLDHLALGALPADSGAQQIVRPYSKGQLALTPRQREEARRRLRQHFASSSNGRANTLSFWVEARTPFEARAAADTILAVLDHAIIDIRRQHASAERAFLESRLDSAEVSEGVIEDSLRAFYLANRIINTPNLQFSEARLKREVDFAIQLTAQLKAQVEQARLQEVHDTPALSVISPPEIPGRRSSPNRSLTAIAAFLGSTLLCFLFVLVRMSVSRQPDRG